MRTLTLAAILGAAALAAAPTHAQITDADDPAMVAHAQALHDSILVIDTHADTPEGLGTVVADPGRITTNQVDLPKMRIGGLTGAFFVVYVGQQARTEEGQAAMRAQQEADYQGIARMLRAYPDQVELATTGDEARRIHAEGRIVALIGMENAGPLGDSVEELEMWRDRGVRYVGITHFGHNQFGDSSNPRTELGDAETEHGGLSPLGRELVAEANRLGIMVDVSHAGRDTMMQAVALSAAPVIASHSGVMAVFENPRNLDDEQLRAIAENGGVAQIVAYDSYLHGDAAARAAATADLRAEMGLDGPDALGAADDATREAYEARLAEIAARYPGATVATLADHLDHAVAVAGIDHVGIASDFEGGGGVAGWRDASETFNVTLELVRRGYSDADIEKIWSGNVLRVLDAAQAAAAD